MYRRGTVCAHCFDAEGDEPCPHCRQAVCISCLLDRVPCPDVEPRVAATRTAATQAMRTLAACGVAVAGGRIVGADVPLWLVASVHLVPIGDPVPGRPDVFALTVRTRAGYAIELLRRSEAQDVDDLRAAAEALAALTGAALRYSDDDDSDDAPA